MSRANFHAISANAAFVFHLFINLGQVRISYDSSQSLKAAVFIIQQYVFLPFQPKPAFTPAAFRGNELSSRRLSQIWALYPLERRRFFIGIKGFTILK